MMTIQRMAYTVMVIAVCGAQEVVAQTKNTLLQVYHHRAAQDVPAIELGQVVFYCTRPPVIKELQTTNKHERIFSLENIAVNDAVKQQIKQFNAIDAKKYKATIELAHSGFKLHLSFDPAQVGLDWGNFVAIKNEAGIGFRLYDTHYLQILGQKRDGLLKTVSAKKKLCVVIDCGHGGIDSGAVSKHNIAEKDVVLSVGKSLAQFLHASGTDVFLTRSEDVAIPLDDRTSFVNSVQADLMVSIHANGAGNEHASGFETFCLPREQLQVAGSVLSSDYKNIIYGMQRDRNCSSEELAGHIHSSVMGAVKKKYKNVVDRRMKHSVAQVLLGTHTPAVLVEIGFLTNEREAKLLADADYQSCIAQAIRDGILQYSKI
ncbi:MAG TPA: N-acetylmuramoyl-L-alanine amidase [Candidatus Babeliales bacterium]|nr:N-acetylmuramoyl-L-alanine amidase [Candidatus Babeliales bacterium]